MHPSRVTLILISFLQIIFCGDEEDLKYKIASPEYICDKDGSIKEIRKDTTTIRLVGNDAQNLKYKFEVNFKTIDAGEWGNNQRCTLLMWRSIRQLEEYLNKYHSNSIETGLIEINNTMFMPGIQYILNITVLNEHNVIEEKQMTMDYVDENAKNSIEKPTASIFLLGANSSYAFTTYVINAEAGVCTNISKYYFKWQLFNENGDLVESFNEKGSELVVPPNIFEAPKTYTIRCDVVDENGESMAHSLHLTSVLSRGLQVSIPVKYITTEINQAVRIQPIIRDLDNTKEKIELTWSCAEDCEYRGETDNELQMDNVFPKTGTYKVTLEVSKGNIKETDFCTIEVLDDAPTVEIEEIENPINPTKGFEIQATVYRLRTSCTLQWTSVDDDGYESLDLNTVPGNVNEIINVTLKEDIFLNELEEYTNETIDKKYDLVIPPKSDDWSGLKGDVTYNFRLITTCPPLEEYSESVAVVTYTDVTVATDAPPEVKPLEVAPLLGEAFVTSFNFRTQKAEDKPGDEPILYKYGYKLESRDVIITSISDGTNTEAVLPFVENGVQTFLEACDVYNSCERVLGPLISTTLPEFNQGVLRAFREKMDTQEYYKAFSAACGVIHSYKTEVVYKIVSDKINGSINQFLEVEQDDGNKWKRPANDLIKNINEFNSILKLPETTLNSLVELRNKISTTENRVRRQLLSLQQEVSLDDIQRYAEVSELIITTSNDTKRIENEKESLRQKLRDYMAKLCGEKSVQLELKTLILSVEKLPRNANNWISIPFDRNSWNVVGKIKVGGDGTCIGKAIFRSYLGKSGTIFMADVYGNNGKDVRDVSVLLPYNHTDGEPSCIVYHDKGWKNCEIVQIISSYVRCNCHYLGYYFLEYSTSTTTLSTALTTTTSTVAATTTAVTNTYFISTTGFPITPSENSQTNKLLSNLTQATTANNYETLSYVVIVASLTGIVILGFILKRILGKDDDDTEDEPFDNLDFPRYAQLYDEETLHDAHI